MIFTPNEMTYCLAKEWEDAERWRGLRVNARRRRQLWRAAARKVAKFHGKDMTGVSSGLVVTDVLP